ncbi:cis-aconitate decarboxylase-like [Polyodon spathula]|uniref:cis-aconitate decarboxylase-like n=1 Tax=Polyodon spathula TaxID=7913 RepID=UPI001B7F478E|nr:cis-aconitate decarboxylase-like [Polyodon spathula]
MLSALKFQRTPRHFSCLRLLHKSAVEVQERPAPEGTVTSSFGGFIHSVHPGQLSDTVLHRSKRMILDSIGVGLLGSTSHVFQLALQHCQQMYAPDYISSVFGRWHTRLSPSLAAFVNGVAVHSMDFDDTWHPATHPSGAVLPALLAIAQMLPGNAKPSGMDLLLAFNVGIEIQGRLMRFSNEAQNIPNRFHPPTVVGPLGSAAACSRLLSLDRSQCSNALAIAASLAGAPMANAATQSKPLHIGNAARLGMEAALLASRGLEASTLILDSTPGCAGFSAFYNDYLPQALPSPEEQDPRFLLEDQDIAFKRFPAHLGMHWVADAACSARGHQARGHAESEHQARHSFQFNACTALLDREVSVQSFSPAFLDRPELLSLLSRVRVEHPQDNPANFNKMYAEVLLTLTTGNVLKGRCDTFYGHWRKPLSRDSLLKKFRANAGAVLPGERVEAIIDAVENIEDMQDCSHLTMHLE